MKCMLQEEWEWEEADQKKMDRLFDTWHEYEESECEFVNNVW